MLKLSSDYSIESELMEVARLFFDPESDDVVINCFFLENPPYLTIDGKFFHVENSLKKFSRACKLALYRALTLYTGKTSPWGALTGVRPTKLGYELQAAGEDVVRGLMEYGVSEQKARVIKRVLENQNGYRQSSKKVNFYVHIPFCTTRCTYCSFVSLPVSGNERLIDSYVEHLIKEIEAGAETLYKGGYEVDSVYIGGGTPTALNDSQLAAVLKAIPYNNMEYTVEAGRPDTITASKLDIMSSFGVTRISINPQTFCDKTLVKIGRAHKAEQIKEVYAMAKGRFDINMDLIAGLTGEVLSDFEHTLDETCALKPQNITVHTLARKNGSVIKTQDKYSSDTSAMVEYAYERLTEAGYEPYYLYRQKNMLENLENIGYTLPGKSCVNNITTMEEFYSVFACGAGAISKRLFEGGRIERYANLRDVHMYVEQFEDRLQKKTKFFL